MRSRLALALMPLLLAGLAASGQDPSDNTSYVNKRAFFFRCKPEQPKGKITELRLFAARDGGPWVYTGRCLPSQDGFRFSTDQDGVYAFAVQAVYEKGELDPPTNDLRADRQRVIIDTQAPKARLQAFVDKGAAGVEWDVADENLDPTSIHLEYRWPDQAAWLPLDRDVAFRARDRRSWELKPDQKLEVRLKASDKAKNEVVTPGVWTPPDPNQAANRFAENGHADTGTTSPSRPTLFHVNSRRVRLEYDVKVGPSGFDHAELWYTTDGREWKLDDKASGEGAAEPSDEKAGKRVLVHEATQDGLYGFIIIARNKAGIGADPPKKGDSARVQVVVDTLKPVVQILKAEPRPNGDHGGAVLDINWAARDANLAPQPITIEYAVDAAGPWKLIADRLDNTGRFTWTVGPNEPYQFYVRVKCEDRARNVGEDHTPKPVIVDLTVPSVDIKDVSPGPR